MNYRIEGLTVLENCEELVSTLKSFKVSDKVKTLSYFQGGGVVGAIPGVLLMMAAGFPNIVPSLFPTK